MLITDRTVSMLRRALALPARSAGYAVTAWRWRAVWLALPLPKRLASTGTPAWAASPRWSWPLCPVQDNAHLMTVWPGPC